MTAEVLVRCRLQQYYLLLRVYVADGDAMLLMCMCSFFLLYDHMIGRRPIIIGAISPPFDRGVCTYIIDHPAQLYEPLEMEIADMIPARA